MSNAIVNPHLPIGCKTQKWEVSEEEKKHIIEYLAAGLPVRILAKKYNVAENTIRNRFRKEVANAESNRLLKIANRLNGIALGETEASRESVTASIFLAKVRLGFKETTVQEHTGKDGQPLLPTIDKPANETREQWIARTTAELQQQADEQKRIATEQANIIEHKGEE